MPYPPGKPLEELEREYGITGSIKLASNENALGPSPKAVAAISAALTNLHRYPDGSNYYLANSLAEKLGVKPAQLVFGNGSNEIIELLAATFLSPGEEVITSLPTFLVYQKMVQAHKGANKVVPLAEKAPPAVTPPKGAVHLGICHDLEAIATQITPKTRLIFLDNPNNPTGAVFSKDEFDAFLAKVPDDVIVVLDEAYVDFVEDAIRIDAREYLQSEKIVVSLRTFSKAYGLAGLRVGYGMMREEVAEYLHRVRQPFNVNTLAQVGALAGLNDEEHYKKTLQMSRDGIAWLSGELVQLGCTPFASQTNFFLVDIGVDGKDFYERMLRRGVIVRPMNAYGFPRYIRITVGLPEENQRLVMAMAKVLEEMRP